MSISESRNLNGLPAVSKPGKNRRMDIAAVTYIAETARECWEEIWPAWKAASGHPDPYGSIPSFDACIPTSFALRAMLHQCVTEWNWYVVGGRPTKRTPLGGFWLPNGQGGPHLWVEGRRPKQRLTVDITADQFGGPEIIITENAVHHIANSTQKLLRSYEVNEELTIILWNTALACALQT